MAAWRYIINASIYRQITNIVKIYVASEWSERGRKFWHFYILKVLFLSTFCRYFKYFVGTNDNYAFGILGAFLHTKSAFFQYFVGTYDNAYGMTLYINDKVLTL